MVTELTFALRISIEIGLFSPWYAESKCPAEHYLLWHHDLVTTVTPGEVNSYLYRKSHPTHVNTGTGRDVADKQKLKADLRGVAMLPTDSAASCVRSKATPPRTDNQLLRQCCFVLHPHFSCCSYCSVLNMFYLCRLHKQNRHVWNKLQTHFISDEFQMVFPMWNSRKFIMWNSCENNTFTWISLVITWKISRGFHSRRFCLSRTCRILFCMFLKIWIFSVHCILAQMVRWICLLRFRITLFA